MTYPIMTAFYAALLAMVLLALSFWVSMGRIKYLAHHGDAGQEDLRRRIRAHANFIEYVPMALILIGLNEAAGASATMVQALLVILLVSRIAHPIGMVAPEASLQQFAFRSPSVLGTWGVILVAALMLLF